MSSVIVSGARTPIGRLLGALSELTAPELGGIALRAAIERAGVDPADTDAVLFGTVVQAGVGPNPARLSAVAAGIPLTVPATSINKLCLSGLAAVAAADTAIRAGDAAIVVAGGTESMTHAPFEADLRSGVRYGSTALRDALERDALVCGIEDEIMGSATERHQAPLGISRQEQDAVALRSHRRAAAATASGLFGDEIVPVTVPASSARSAVVVSTDEGIRPDTDAASLARLRPAFSPTGTITAGSASQLSDGAAALVVMDGGEATRRGSPVLAEILGCAAVAGPDTSLLLQPACAIERAAARAGVTVSDLRLIEINEAFASVPIASTRALGIDPEIVNVNGGAIALGHPVGMSGARILLTLALELRRRGGGLGAAALCGGGGQGEAIIIRVPEEHSA